MTSEGHYAGSQPAEATSGGPTSDGFPPDGDGQRNAGRASAQPPADGFPSSYAPPPQATPNGGSPFVVPAVGQRSSGTSYGSARVPAPSPDELPQRNGASPYGSVSPFPPADSAPAEQPPSAWAPPPAPPRAELPQRTPSASSDAPPLPQRNPTTPPELVEFDGFAAAGGTSSPSASPSPEQSSGRPAGLSAFGDQRVRVPGATLTGLPDAPPPPRPTARDESAQQGSGFPLRGGNGTFMTRRGDSGGFPLRSASGAEGEGESADAPPATDLPIRGRTGYAPSSPSGFNGFGEAAPAPASSSSPSGEVAHPYARAVPDQPARPASDEHPFGRAPFGRPSDDEPPAPAFAPSPFGGASSEDEHAPFRRPEPAEPPAGDSAGNGYPRRVPGAAFGAAGLNGFGPSSDSPVASDSASVSGSPSGAGPVPQAPSFGAADSPFGGAAASPYGSAADDAPGGSVPQPRDSADRSGHGPGSRGAGSPGSPAVGSARPVTASASVPSASRVAPVDASELPPPAAAPQARVYGRAAAPEPDHDEPAARHDDDQRSAGAYGSPAFPAPQGRAGGTYGAAPPADRNGFFPADDPAPPAAGRENGNYGSAAVPGPQGGENPFGASAQGGNPFGASAQGSSPFSERAGDQADGQFAERHGDRGEAGPFGAPGARDAERADPPVFPGARDGGPTPFGSPAFPPHDADHNSSALFPGSRDGGQPGSGPFGSPDFPSSREAEQDGSSPFSGGPFGSPTFPGGRDGGQGGSAPFGSPAHPGQQGNDQGGSTGFASGAYGNRVSDDQNGDRPAPGVAPQSPARATARASASARVAPPAAPPEQGAQGGPAQGGPGQGGPGQGGPAQGGPAFGDLIGNSQDGPPASRFAPEQYSEHTTDIAGRDSQPRDSQPYVPAPALPPFPPEATQVSAQPHFGPGSQPAAQPRFGPGSQPAAQPHFGPGAQQHGGQQQFPQGNQAEFGQGGGQQGGQGGQPQFGQTALQPAFQQADGGPALRATVTPPTPEDTTSWPGVEADQGKFDQFKAETAPAAKPETPHVRMLPILIAVVVGAGLLVGLAFGIVYLVAGNDGGSKSTSSFSVNTGDCVKKSGDAAVKAACGDAGSYKVTAIVSDKSKCPDQQQPYVLNPTSNGKTQVLCLKPNG